MLYGALFLVAGTALLAITYGLVANGTDGGGQAMFFTLRHRTGQAAAAARELSALPQNAAAPSKGRGGDHRAEVGGVENGRGRFRSGPTPAR